MPDIQATPVSTTDAPHLPGADLPAQLADLRADIDRLDDAMHDLLMRRARVVERVAELGRIGKIPFRPGREAAIIRRLLARHSGRLPERAIVRFWREMFAANISIESRFVIAVFDAAPAAPMGQQAREHFGALTPLRVVGAPGEALALVRIGEAAAAVLPLPGGEPAWWPGLHETGEIPLHVVARLPFWGRPRPEGAVVTEALVVAAAAPDPSGSDLSLLAVDPSRAAASGAQILDRESGEAGRALIEVAGMWSADDPRLGGWPGAVVLGGYAVPIGGGTQ